MAQLVWLHSSQGLDKSAASSPAIMHACFQEGHSGCQPQQSELLSVPSLMKERLLYVR